MANLITDDFLDAQIKAKVTATDLTNADLFLVDFANGQNVAEEDIETDSLPFKVKQLLINWTLCEVCRRNVGQNIQITSSGDKTDWYLTKLKLYEKELDKYMFQCTAKVLEGDQDEDDDKSETSTMFERA